MGLLIHKVIYRDFRNMAEFELAPDPHVTILVGPNAVGKTNCMEGIQLLTEGRSFRKASADALLRKGCEHGRVALEAHGAKRVLELACDITPQRRTYEVNGKKRPRTEAITELPCILFWPDELGIIKGSAQGRRDIIDAFGMQMNRTYGKIWTDYKCALTQRNALLKARAKGEPVDGAMFDAWTDSLVNTGSMLYLYRVALFSRLMPLVVDSYSRLGRESLEGRYVSCYARESRRKEDVQEGMRRCLDERAADERRRAQTLVGPHLDDIEFTLDGGSARMLASQGQQRSIILALKVAQVHLVRELQGQYPVLLLDDVMSELDSTRCAHLVSLISRDLQTIITTTRLDYFEGMGMGQTKVVRLGDR